MSKEQKNRQVRTLKAELCIQYMITRLRPNPTNIQTICDAMYACAIVNQIRIVASQPIFIKGGLAICGNNDRKEIILKK